jgi:hypothetical protein
VSTTVGTFHRITRADKEIGEEDKKAFDALSAMIAEQSSTRGLQELKVVFGPGNSFYASAGQDMLWHNLPKAMVMHIEQRRSSKVAVPRVVALGSQGTWLAIWGKDDMKYELGPFYKTLVQNFPLIRPADIKVVDHLFLSKSPN